MDHKLARRNDPARRLLRRNTMAFPRELRDAIPDLHAGRALELDSINGQFVVLMDLQPDAARELAAELTRLADAADGSQPV